MFVRPLRNECPSFEHRHRDACVALHVRGELQPEADDIEPQERELKVTIVFMLLLSYADLVSDLALAILNIMEGNLKGFETIVTLQGNTIPQLRADAQGAVTEVASYPSRQAAQAAANQSR